jgi:hypothetical protein
LLLIGCFLRYKALIGYCLQVPGFTLRWTVACNDLTTWRLNLLLIGCFFKIPVSYWLLLTGARFYTALDRCMQRSDHLEIELASHWLFFKMPGSYWLLFTQVPGSTLLWTVACNDLTTWRLNLILIGCFLRYQALIGYCLQVAGSTLRWTVACNDLTTWRLNLILIGCFLRYQALIGGTVYRCAVLHCSGQLYATI